MHYKRLSKLIKAISIFMVRSTIKIVKLLKLTQKIRLYILIISFVFAKEKLKLNIKDYPKLL